MLSLDVISCLKIMCLMFSICSILIIMIIITIIDIITIIYTIIIIAINFIITILIIDVIDQYGLFANVCDLFCMMFWQDHLCHMIIILCVWVLHMVSLEN